MTMYYNSLTEEGKVTFDHETNGVSVSAYGTGVLQVGGWALLWSPLVMLLHFGHQHLSFHCHLNSCKYG